MQIHNKSEKRAREILDYYLNAVTKKFKGEIKAIILVGSLSNGSYVEGQGRDIDQITIVNDDVTNEIIKSIFKLIEDITNYFNNDIPISKTIYRICEMKRPFKTEFNLSKENKHLLEITTELQRVHESGIKIYGENIIGQLPRPTREEIIFFDELARRWCSKEKSRICKDPRIINDLSMRIIVQSVLTNAFRHYYYATGNSCSNKNIIAAKIKNEVNQYKFQNLLDMTEKLRLDPSTKLSEIKENEIREEYKEFRKWVEDNSVDAVPLELI